MLVAACSATSPPPLPPHHPTTAASEPTVPPRPPDLPTAAEPPMVDDRYFGTMLAVDLVAVVPLTYWSFHTDRWYLPLPALVLPPLVHLAHGQTQSAAISFAMNGAMIGLVSAASTSGLNECRSSSDVICVPFASILLASTATTLAILVDSLVLARESRPADRWRQLRVLPSAGGVVLMGRF
jgi:hypothetical protein